MEVGFGALPHPSTQVISLKPAFSVVGMIDLTARGGKKEKGTERKDETEEKKETTQIRNQAWRGDKLPHRWQRAVCEIINRLLGIINPPGVARQISVTSHITSCQKKQKTKKQH